MGHSTTSQPSSGRRAIAEVALDEEDLREVVAGFLSRDRGEVVNVAMLTRERSAFATLFPVEVLHVTLASGEELSVFLKHFGDEQSDHPDKQCRDREVRIYEALLQDPGLPVARYYGARRNGDSCRLELYLEHIKDWNLKYQPIACWFDAVRQLAHLHLHFLRKPGRLANCPFLIRLDAAYHQRWAERGLSMVNEWSADLGARLQWVIDGYAPIAALLGAQPPTLVHNDLGRKNVLVDRSATPVRVCLIDWEMAGVGCALHDLIHLRSDRLDPETDRAVIEAYCAEVAGTPLLPSDQGAARQLLDACELHRTLYRLAHSKLWNKPIDYVTDRVERARTLFAGLR